VLGSFRLGLVSLRGRDQFVAGFALVDVDELIPKAGRELPLDLACGPPYFARRIDVAPLRAASPPPPAVSTLPRCATQRPMQAAMPASASSMIQGIKPAALAMRRAA